MDAQLDGRELLECGCLEGEGESNEDLCYELFSQGQSNDPGTQ